MQLTPKSRMYTFFSVCFFARHRDERTHQVVIPDCMNQPNFFLFSNLPYNWRNTIQIIRIDYIRSEPINFLRQTLQVPNIPYIQKMSQESSPPWHILNVLLFVCAIRSETNNLNAINYFFFVKISRA